MIKFVSASFYSALLICFFAFARDAFAQEKLEFSAALETNLGPSVQSHLSSWVKTDKSKLSLVKEPVYQSSEPQYGTVLIGNSTNKKEIVVVIDEVEGKPARIYVDANNNRDLTDDGKPEWTPNENGVLFKSINIDAAFSIDGKEQIIKLPYGFVRFTDNIRKQAGVFYGCEFGRSGTVKIRDQKYNFIVMTASSQGLFTKPDDLRLVIDIKQTGKLDTSADSKQSYDQGQAFLLDGEIYRFSGTSVIGDKIFLEPLPLRIPPKWNAEVGDNEADFGFKTLDGKSLKLSDFKGKVVLLDFWATWCGPCRADLPNMKKLYSKFDHSKFEIIGVSVDGKETGTNLQKVQNYVEINHVNWPITFSETGWNALIALLYKAEGIPYQLIIDKNGVIRMIERGVDESGEKVPRYSAEIQKLIDK